MRKSILALMLFCFAGCAQPQDKNKLIGTWDLVDSPSENIKIKVIFTETEMTIAVYADDEPPLEEKVPYKINNGEIDISRDGKAAKIKYVFDVDNNLVLTSDTFKFVLKKNQ